MQCDAVEKRKSRYFLFKEYFSLRNGSILKYQVFRDIGVWDIRMRIIQFLYNSSAMPKVYKIVITTSYKLHFV